MTSYNFSGIAADHTIDATFAIDTFTLTATAGAHGAIDPAGATVKDHGADQSYTITPDAHYHVAGLLVDGRLGRCGDQLHPERHRRRSHHRGRACAIDAFTVTATAGAHGAIDPDGCVTVKEFGADQSYTITPDAHSHVADVTWSTASRWVR